MIRDFQKKIFDRLIADIGQVSVGYSREQVRGLLRTLFDSNWPSDLFREKLPEDMANAAILLKGRAATTAANFVDKNLRLWFEIALLLLIMIGKREGEVQMINAFGITPKDRHGIRGYKQSAHFLVGALIDHLRLPKNKGGRPRDEELTRKIEAAFSALEISDEETCQEIISNILLRKTGKPIKPDTARKRLNRKGKTLSGKKRKSRKIV
jgi:hypothetical protein